MYFRSVREKNAREIREGCEILKIKKSRYYKFLPKGSFRAIKFPTSDYFNKRICFQLQNILVPKGISSRNDTAYAVGQYLTRKYSSITKKREIELNHFTSLA
jgi:hypothetical protein